jgi:hypothetical protein
MQRFFRLERDNIRRHRRPSRTWSATQPLDNAVAKVIGTSELLEGTLAHLPELDLIASTRVNKTFRHIIQDSPTLLRMLFLQPPRECSEIIARGDVDNKALGERSGHDTGYELVTLCPLLFPWLSNLTMNTRFGLRDHEAVGIDPSAQWADSFTHMYMTNPPCTEVEIVLEYLHVGTEPGKGYFTGDKGAETAYVYRAVRTVRCQTGVTFAALMEAVYARGDVKITINERVLYEYGDEDDKRMLEDLDTFRCSLVKKNTTLYDEVKALEQKLSVVMSFNMQRGISLHGARVWDDADKAEAAREKRELEMQSKQGNYFQKVLVELRERSTVADATPLENTSLTLLLMTTMVWI